MVNTSHSFNFCSPEGNTLFRNILKNHLPYEPHDYQLEGACKALDGIDVLAVTPTGSGKTGFMSMMMLVMCAIAREPSLCPRVKFKKDPAMLVICPTKALQLDMEPKFSQVGLSTAVINEDTVHDARLAGRDLWDTVRSRITMILLSLEQLQIRSFESLLHDKQFEARIAAFGVDEVHLLIGWGSFRPVFKQIGHTRMRLPGQPVLVGLTASLQAGPPMKEVCQFLSLHSGRFHFIRRSNARYNIQIIFRQAQSGARATRFPELNWVLEGNRRIIVFCTTIAWGYRVATYLWHKAVDLPDRVQRVHMYTSINSPTYNADTLAYMHNDPRSRVTIATDTLAVGIDAAGTDDVVLFGDVPASSDMLIQKAGHIRDGTGKSSRAIVYLLCTATESARKVM
ncbi:P-loop containing nucleoside triphosphate hydrolase protein, partial [Amylocystis lapponica]